jgi:hypothetical protein
VFNNTEIPVTNHYGFGDSSDVVGTIGFASVQLGKYTFEQQGISILTLQSIMINDFLSAFSNATKVKFMRTMV